MKVLSTGLFALSVLALAGTSNAQFATRSSGLQKGAVAPATRVPALPPGTQTLLVGGGDDCAAPDVISGTGSTLFDLTTATTGTQGQNEGLCLFFGSTVIDSDVWFRWTATSSGTAIESTCNTTSVDTKLAVYAGSACPASGSAIACNDDSCGLQSTVLVDVTAGSTYMIQVGTFPAATTGTGSIDISYYTPPPCYTLDDGTSDNSVGLTAGGDLIILNGFQAGGGADVVTQISATYGALPFPGGYPNPVPMTVAIWNDPTNDFDPSDAVLLYSQGVPAPGGAFIDTDVFQQFPVPNVPVTGVFFIGIMFDNHAAGQFPAALDQTLPSGGRSWFAGSTTGTADLTNLMNNNAPPTAIDTIGGFAGRWMLRAVGPNCNAGGSVGTPFCFGDGSGTPCPCGNTGAPGRGCANSTASGGARLTATGAPSVSAGNLVLRGDGAQPGQPGLYFQGDNAINGGNGIQNGDGLRCAGGGIRRLQVVTAGGAASPNPGASQTTVNIAAAGNVSPGQTKRYQWWYRNPSPNAPCGTSFNLSNGLEITWVP